MMPAREPWRSLGFSRLPADEQVAWTEALLESVGRTAVPALRWRETAPEALVLGRGQPLAGVDLGACRAAGVHVYRRSTGGTAVLSGPDLLVLDVVLPAGHRLAPANVAESYRWLGEALAAGLRALGIAAEAISPEAARRQARELTPGDPLRRACFATLSPYEVTVAGRKLIGLAQARHQQSVLLQAAILLRWNAERLARLLAIPEQPPLPAAASSAGVHALHDRAIGLDEIGVGLDRDALIAHLTDAVATAARAEPRPDEWAAEEGAAFARARDRFVPLA